MKLFYALEIRWTAEREPRDVKYKGRRIFTEVRTERAAEHRFRNYLDRQDTFVPEIAAMEADETDVAAYRAGKLNGVLVDAGGRVRQRFATDVCAPTP